MLGSPPATDIRHPGGAKTRLTGRLVRNIRQLSHFVIPKSAGYSFS